MTIELIVHRSNHGPSPWTWEILDACVPVQRSRQTFDTADLARTDGQKVIAAKVSAVKQR